MLNFKFYHKRGKCFGCVLTEERKIKEKGEEAWKKYRPNMDIKAKNFKRIVKWGKKKIGDSEKE